MNPPFKITNNMLNQIITISEIVGNLEIYNEVNLRLRKENRIKSIQSSLAIENNSMTIDQVTAIINGKRVLGTQKEILEVKNAISAYEKVQEFSAYSETDFLKAHRIMMNEMIGSPGSYRTSDVGIFDGSGRAVHLGARPNFISKLVSDLFEWLRTDDSPLLIKSCVFHYEIETIHPFEDGNGRMGRFWQTVLLTYWNPIFEWIPIETMIKEYQQEYYKMLSQADRENDSTVFIEFMLDIIIETLLEYGKNSKSSRWIIKDELSTYENTYYNDLIVYFEKNEYITTKTFSEIIGRSEPTARRYLSKYSELGFLEAIGKNKNRRYKKTLS